MDDKDVTINKLTKEVAKWRNRTAEAIERACDECDEYLSRKNTRLCAGCRIEQIRSELAGDGR